MCRPIRSDRRWSATRDNDALQLMVAAACALDDGKLARDETRALPTAQTVVSSAYRASSIPIAFSTDG